MRRLALVGAGFDLLCEHGDNVLLDSCDGAVEISRNTNNLVVLDDGLVHEVLSAFEGTLIKSIYLIAYPLCPCFRSEDFSIHGEEVLDLFRVEEGSGCRGWRARNNDEVCC